MRSGASFERIVGGSDFCDVRALEFDMKGSADGQMVFIVGSMVVGLLFWMETAMLHCIRRTWLYGIFVLFLSIVLLESLSHFHSTTISS